MGGENPGSHSYCVQSWGSSPRGRGKLRPKDRAQKIKRLIPAWAGKTHPHWSRSSVLAAHPRVGGENAFGITEIQAILGSSPRGRGKPLLPATSAPTLRLIPAWAGKTLPRQRSVVRRAAHPRVGGENGVARLAYRMSTGSSPRGRGKRAARVYRWVEHGLIPAWAGKTSGQFTDHGDRWAHPRVGGENSVG